MGKEKETIRTIYHKEVLDFFKALGLLEALERGEINCSSCGETITINNFKAVARKSGSLLFCCAKHSCIQELVPHVRSDQT